jgi:hypothetical protein
MDSNLPPQNPNVVATPQAPVSQKPATWQLVLTILFLLMWPIVGVIFMWVWMKNWPKILKILITLVVGVIIVVGIIAFVWFVYFFSKTPTYDNPYSKTSLSTPAPATDSAQVATSSADLTNWKNYTNSKYSYSLKYPPQASYSEASGSGMVRGTTTGETEPVQIITFKVDGGTLTIKPNPGGHGIQSVNRKEVTIAGKTTTKIYTSTMDGLFLQIANPQGDYLEFDFTLPTTNTQKVDAEVDQMLSTFKFN